MTNHYYADWRDVSDKLWRWPNFSPEEIACRGDGTIRINEAALDKLQDLRDRLGAPLIVNSAYRSPNYNRQVGGATLSPLAYHYEHRAEIEVIVQGTTPEVRAVASGPADDVVQIVEILVSEGEQFEAGQIVAVVETAKAAVDICAQAEGIVLSLECKVGDEVEIGKPILKFEPTNDIGTAEAKTTEVAKLLPVILGRAAPKAGFQNEPSRVGFGAIKFVTGDRIVTTEELCVRWPDRSAIDLVKSTGIRERRWVSPTQTLLSMAVEAAHNALSCENLSIRDIGLVVAATGTPDIVTPSLASRVSASLAGDLSSLSMVAYDINAACSGYLYAVDQCFSYLTRNPDATAMVITSEVLSPSLNLDDPDTASIFADAATATIVRGPGWKGRCRYYVRRPIISGQPETGEMISVPLNGNGHIAMKGRKVFSDAVRSMTSIVEWACVDAGVSIRDLQMIVPHQANQRILDTIERRTGCKVFSAIEKTGNTSSCSIPIALVRLECESGIAALTSFGGGYTSAAAIVEIT